MRVDTAARPAWPWPWRRRWAARRAAQARGLPGPAPWPPCEPTWWRRRLSRWPRTSGQARSGLADHRPRARRRHQRGTRTSGSRCLPGQEPPPRNVLDYGDKVVPCGRAPLRLVSPATRRAWSGRRRRSCGHQQTAVDIAPGHPHRDRAVVVAVDDASGTPRTGRPAPILPRLERVRVGCAAIRPDHGPARPARLGAAGRLLDDNTTWQAYNTWRRSSLLPGRTRAPSDRGYAVSFDQPYDGDGAVQVPRLQ